MHVPYLDDNKRHALRGWFAGDLGWAVLEQERAHLDELLQDLFGYYLLQIGAVTSVELLEASRIRMRVVMDAELPPLIAGAQVRARTDAVPVASDTIDVVLLHHTLEFAADPHALLREVERILIPEGHVVIVAFNPWSFWGAWRLVRKRGGQPPWCGRFLGLARVKDWLGLLGFDTVKVQPLFFRPPLRHQGVMRRLGFMDRMGGRLWPLLAGVHIVVGKKRVATLTPIKTRWRAKPALVGGEVVKPTTGHVGHG